MPTRQSTLAIYPGCCRMPESWVKLHAPEELAAVQMLASLASWTRTAANQVGDTAWMMFHSLQCPCTCVVYSLTMQTFAASIISTWLCVHVQVERRMCYALACLQCAVLGQLPHLCPSLKGSRFKLGRKEIIIPTSTLLFRWQLLRWQLDPRVQVRDQYQVFRHIIFLERACQLLFFHMTLCFRVCFCPVLNQVITVFTAVLRGSEPRHEYHVARASYCV